MRDILKLIFPESHHREIWVTDLPTLALHDRIWRNS